MTSLEVERNIKHKINPKKKRKKNKT